MGPYIKGSMLNSAKNFNRLQFMLIRHIACGCSRLLLAYYCLKQKRNEKSSLERIFRWDVSFSRKFSKCRDGQYLSHR